MKEYTYIIFFRLQKAKYVYDLRSKTCKKYSLDEPFVAIGIPPSARFVDSRVIGTNAIEQYGLTVNLWEQVLRVDSKQYFKC